jgi:hypothetical protein
MAATLREVLNAFRDQTEPVSMAQLSRQLELSPAMLNEMIAYWVNRGRLRLSTGENNCTTCGVNECPFVMCMPRSYEYVPLHTQSVQ